VTQADVYVNYPASLVNIFLGSSVFLCVLCLHPAFTSLHLAVMSAAPRMQGAVKIFLCYFKWKKRQLETSRVS
jgi:hypothetical protein